MSSFPNIFQCGPALLMALVLGCGSAGSPASPSQESSSRTLQEEGVYIKSVMSTVLGRTPAQQAYTDPYGLAGEVYDEMTLGVQVMGSLSDPLPARDLLVAGLLTRPEAEVPSRAEVEDPPAWIRDTFRTLLGRDPSEEELDMLVEEWNADEAVDPQVILRALLTSWEYSSR